ncbi:Hsp20 family protein [Klebsiella pneumoniae subsp. pneumoniae]|nr:Hsp20 family protein [Klebsiella pneumoniae subsp. pneumoniae]
MAGFRQGRSGYSTGRHPSGGERHAAAAGKRDHMAAPGLVSQAFSLSFTLADNMEVSGATFTNGLLHIDLTRNEPEQIAPQRIAISERPALNS